MFCKYCGNEVVNDSVYCVACHKKIKKNRSFCITSSVFTYVATNYALVAFVAITLLLVVGAGISGMWGDGTMSSIIDAVPEFFFLVCLGLIFSLLSFIFSILTVVTCKKLKSKQIPVGIWIKILSIVNLCMSIESILTIVITLLMCF